MGNTPSLNYESKQTPTTPKYNCKRFIILNLLYIGFCCGQSNIGDNSSTKKSNSNHPVCRVSKRLRGDLITEANKQREEYL